MSRFVQGDFKSCIVRLCKDFNKMYKFQKDLTSGKFGEIKLYKNIITNELISMKFFTINKTFDLKNSLRDATMCKTLSAQFDFVPKYYDDFLWKDVDHQYYYIIIMDFIPGYNLKKYTAHLKRNNKTFSSKQLNGFATWLITCIKFLHEKGYVHRDIKAANIMYNTDTKKYVLVDFGLSCSLSNNEFKNYKHPSGTPSHLSPEMIKYYRQPVSARDNTFLFCSSDIWAIGILLYTLINFKSPWDTSEESTAYDRIVDDTYKLSIPDSSITDVISKLLDRNVETRLSLNDALTLLARH